MKPAAVPDPWPRLPLRRIVCGTDFSAPAEHAVERAWGLAREHGATLSLVHVVPSSLWEDAGSRLAGLLGADVPPPDALQARALAQLRRRIARRDPRSDVRCEPLVELGRPAPQLARLAQSLAADLLVVADRGAHSLHDLVLGTTAQHLLRSSPCPVLVVKRAAAAPYRRVLAPTDFSELSRRAVRATAALLPQAQLHLAHAFELPFDGIVRAGVSASARQHYRREAQRRLREDLRALAGEVGVPAPHSALHVEHGYPGACIERWIGALDIDLVSVAAGGKSGVERMVLGSVSLHTVSHAACDVLLLRGIE